MKLEDKDVRVKMACCPECGNPSSVAIEHTMDKQSTKEFMKEVVKYNLYETPINQIKPIPLTEELLLKCGFEGFDKDEYTLILSNGNFFTLNCEEPIAKNIKYLHQLQNLYFALTNQELKCSI